MTGSIHNRILLSAFLVLVLFVSLTGLILDNIFINNVEQSQRKNLRAHVYMLLATAELDDDKNHALQLPEELTEPRLNMYESTLHARILSVANKVIWQSKSMLNTNLPLPTKIKVGEFSFSKKTLNKNTYSLLNFTTIWVGEKDEYGYVFQVAENTEVLNKQITSFRKNLWFWLIGLSFILITLQTIILRWGLKPLRYVAEDLINIEKGTATTLNGDYPKEIIPLTNNLNQLLDSSQQHLSRYRDALGNMAHSLKTPIAILQGIINETAGDDKNMAKEQLHTINNIVEYQLQRAATAGRLQLAQNVNLKPIVNKILSSLKKVHVEKNIQIQVEVPDKITLKMDQGDLYEILGNLLENAFKWSESKIFISSEQSGNQTHIIIEDDGPGINCAEKERILLRGQRADQSTPGHGLGLAMVSDILLIYEANLEISESHLGGAKITITI